MLEHFPGYQTGDLSLIREITLSKFGAQRFEASSPNPKVFVKAKWGEATDIKVITAVCSLQTNVFFNELTSVRQYFEIGQPGRLEFQVGGKTTSLSSAIPSIVVPSSVAFGIRGRPNQHVISLRIENEALKNLAGTLVADDCRGDVEFNCQFDKNGLFANLRQSVVQFIADLDLMGPDAPKSARDVFAQSLMIKFLLCNSDVFRSRMGRRAPAPSNAQLRAIEEFIETNWHRPVDVQELSEVFNISTRTIFRHFKMKLGISPLEYNKNIKLRRARSLLEKNHENVGVMAIAMMCGFHSIGHFSRDYRDAFLELPSQTLQRSRSNTHPRK